MSVQERQRRRMEAKAAETPGGPIPSRVAAMKAGEGVQPYTGEVHFDGVYGMENIVEGVKSGAINTTYDGPDLNEEQAVRLMREYAAGNISEGNKTAALEALQFFDSQNPGVLQSAKPQAQPTQIEGQVVEANMPDGDFANPGDGTAIIGDEQFMTDSLENRGRVALGMGELGLTMLTGAVGEVVGGLAALGHGGLGLISPIRGNADDMANTVNAVSDFMTFTPKTKGGQMLLRTIGGPLMKLDNGARDLSTWLASDNPVAATTLYTTIMGGTELLGLKGINKVKPGQAVKAREAKVNQIASDMGINLEQSKLPGDVVKAANEMAPGTRHANAEQLQMDLFDARRQSRANLNIRVEAARSVDASVSASDVSKFGDDMDALLRAEGYDIESMSAVSSAIQDLIDMPRHSPLTGPRAGATVQESGLILPPSVQNNAVKAAASTEASLNEIWTIRNRIEKAMVNEKRVQNLPNGANQNMALRLLDRKLDDFLDHQYVNDMVSGDPVAIDAWRAADDARVHHNRTFNENTTINNLMDIEATPEQITQYIRGASTTSPKRQSAAVIRRLKDILGPEHNSIKGIQQDYLFEIVEPLMSETPQFGKFIDNYDSIVRNNPSIVKELGLNMTQLEELRDFATVANRLPAGSTGITVQDVATAISRLWVGHSIAKQGMKVSIFARVLGGILGRDTVSKKRILAEAAGIKYGEPVIPKGSQAAATVAQSAVLADITEAEEKRKRRNRGE